MRPKIALDHGARRQQRYIEFPFGDTEHLRITHLPDGVEGHDDLERFRVQIRNANGHLRGGPQLTYGELADVLWAAGYLRTMNV